MTKRVATAAAIAALTCGLAAATPAIAASDFYAGKTVSITIGYGPGGTYDKYSRILADHLSRHIPGTPTIVVKYMPGAGGLKAVNFAYNAMPRDGLNIIMPADPLVVQQLMRPEKIKYDARRFTWLGGTNQTNTVLVARTSSGVTSLEDLRRKPLIVGTVGPGSTSYVFPKLAKEMLGLKLMKIISGYRGSSKTILAVEQGETQAAAFNWLAWSSKVPQWFTKGEAKPLLQIGIWKDPDLSDVPMIGDLVAARDKPIIDFIATHGVVGRGLAMPPGVSRDKIATLTAAFAKTVKDPAYIATAKKRRLRVIASSGADIQKAVNDAFVNADAAVVARARELVFGKK